jgi:O-antigen ligase
MPSHLTSEYEPVTPLRRSTPQGDEAGRDERGAVDDDDPWAPAGGGGTPPAERPAASGAARGRSQRVKKPWLERWSTKRGHALGFAGLFLFTFILYFRPYEQVSFLASFTSMAFWTAVLTLALFFPAQLSLEGSLTARPREVNLLLLLALTALLSIPLALNRAEAWDTFVEPFSKAGLMFLVIVNTVRTLRRLRWMLLLGVAVGCMLSVVALNQYRTTGGTVEGYRVEGSIGNLFQNPNDMAIHLITIIPIVVAFMFGARGLKKVVYAVCLFLLVGGMMVTFSRGGFLGLAGCAAVLGWKLGRRNRFPVFALLLVAVVLMVLLAPGGYSTRMLSIFDSSLDPVGSSSARQQLLILSIKTAILHPLLGVGMGNFHIISIREAVTHNSYTQVAAELGMAAAVCYTLFVVTPLARLRRIERATLESRRASGFYYLSVGMQASIVAYMIGSFFGAIAYHWYVYYIVGYAVALRRIYATTAEVKGPEESPSAKASANVTDGGHAAAGRDVGTPARTDSAGTVLYDAREARVVEG